MVTEYKDERGRIIDVSDLEFHGLQIIESKKGSVRSNHFHKRGGHLLYILSGKMEYIEATVPAITAICGGMVETEQRTKIISAGESIFTGPMIAHKTTFLEDTVMVCCPTMRRTDGGYLDDLVRCEL